MHAHPDKSGLRFSGLAFIASGPMQRSLGFIHRILIPTKSGLRFSDVHLPKGRDVNPARGRDSPDRVGVSPPLHEFTATSRRGAGLSPFRLRKEGLYLPILCGADSPVGEICLCGTAAPGCVNPIFCFCWEFRLLGGPLHSPPLDIPFQTCHYVPCEWDS